MPQNLITVEECSQITHFARHAEFVVNQSGGFEQCALTLHRTSFLEITRRFGASMTIWISLTPAVILRY